MKMNFDDPTLTKILSIITAIFLFMFVSYEGGNRSNHGKLSVVSQSKTEVLSNIPVLVDIDNSQYYTSGVPESVAIRLDGPQSVITQTVVTQNFTVKTPNLTDLGVGVHKIQLEAEGISEELNYNLSPSEATVKIEEKQSREYDVEVSFDKVDYLAKGYDVKQIKLSEDRITIAGAESTLNNIHDVRAIIQPSQTNITSSFNVEARIVVLNEQGEPLNVNVVPSTVNASVSIINRKKEVGIHLKETGKIDSQYQYDLQLSDDESSSVLISGDYEKISKIDALDVEVDLSGVTESTTRQVPIILPDGVDEVSQSRIEIKITVKK